MKKLSIVVTNYNKGKRVTNLLHQLEKQIDDRIEVVVVDDSSTDGSREQLIDFTKMRFNFKLYLNGENLGPGIARNRGLDLCTGEWITFIDGDDEIKPNYIERILELIETDKYDLISFNYEINNCVDNEEVEYALNTMLWTKIFRGSIFYENHIRVDEILYKGLVFGEDLELLYLYMCKTDRHLKVEDKLIKYNWGIGICNRPPERYEVHTPDGWVEEHVDLFTYR